MDLIFNYYNKRIKEIYNNDLGNYINRKEFLKINQDQKQKMNSNYNKLLLDKKMKDIFGVNISKKYKNYRESFNIELINNLLIEKDEEKRIKFNLLFNKAFKECIMHLRGDAIIEERA